MRADWLLFITAVPNTKATSKAESFARGVPDWGPGRWSQNKQRYPWRCNRDPFGDAGRHGESVILCETCWGCACPPHTRINSPNLT
jgi:hypothetical protein